MSGQQAAPPQRGSVTLPQWPEHLVPCCLDMATSRPFPFVLDIIHITDYSTLDYYPSPRRFFEEVFPASSAQTEFVRRLSRSSIIPTIPMGRSQRAPALAQVARDIVALTGSARRVSINSQPQRIEKVEVFLRPAGQVTISAASSFSEPSNAGQNLSDDDRLFALHLPNQTIYMKPNSNAQRSLLIKFIQKWLRISTVPYFSSRVVFLVIDFTVTTSDAVDQGGRKMEKAKRDYAADASAMQLKAATVAVGTFVDAKHVVGEHIVPMPQVQQYRTTLSGATPSDRRRLVVALPFSFGSQEMISIGLRHESLGWLTPAQSLSVSLGQIVGLHRTAASAYHMPLFLQGAFQGKVRSWASVWWAPDQSLNLSVAFSCKNLVRSDFFLPDPACFVSLTAVEKDAHGTKRRRGKFVHFSEAYRNRRDVEFAPFSLSFPVDLPLELRKSVNFVSEASSLPTADGGGLEKHLSRIFSSSIPLNPVERASKVTENDQFPRLDDGSQLGNDNVFPGISATDVLLFEVLDGHYDAIMKDCLPAVMGTTTVSVDDLLSVTNDVPPQAGDPPLLTYSLSSKPGLQLTESTSLSTLERLREKQKSKFPLSARSFVFFSQTEATENTNSKVLPDKQGSSAAKLGSCELGICKTSLTERPTFLQFLHSGTWDFSSMIFVDLTQSSLRAHRRAFVSVKPSGDGAASTVSDLNVFETLIVAINKMLVPCLCRGGSDLYGFGSGQDSQTSVFPIHQYPEAFGVAVDETTAVDRRVVAESPLHHAKANGEAPTPRAGLPMRGNATVPPFPILRDWTGELTLGTYRSKRSAVTAKYDAGDDAGAESLGEGCSQLCPLLRRASQRTTSLAAARSAAIERGASCIPSQSFQVVTIVVHSNVADAVEAAHLIASWIERPMGFILIFLDTPAPIVFGGIPNCFTLDMQCCQGKFLGALALHRQLRTVEDTFSRIPSLFLAFARVSGVTPTLSPEGESEVGGADADTVADPTKASAIADIAAVDLDEEFKVERKKFASTSQRFRNAFGGTRPHPELSSPINDSSAAPRSPTQRRLQSSTSMSELHHAQVAEEQATSLQQETKETHARIVDVYVPEEELVYLELESARQLARLRNAASSGSPVAPATSRARSTVGRTAAQATPISPVAPTTLLDDGLVRKHVDRLMAQRIPIPRSAEVDRVADDDDDIVAVVMARHETVNASDVAVMLQCEPSDAQQLLSVAVSKGQSPNSVAPPRTLSQSAREERQLLADVGDEADSDGVESEVHLSPKEKRTQREKEELEKVVEDALRSMYKGWSKEMLDEVTQEEAKNAASEKGSPKRIVEHMLKAIDRFDIYKAADPVTDIRKYRTTNMKQAAHRARAFGQASSAIVSTSQTAQGAPAGVPQPPPEQVPGQSLPTEKKTDDVFVQELPPEKRKRLNELLMSEKVFHGGPILNPDIARKQQELAERRIDHEARTRAEQQAAAIAAAPQRAKDRQKKLQQWKTAFRRSNRVVEEDDPDVLS